MKTREDKWKKLPNETKDFVLRYLKNNLKIEESEFQSFLFPDYEKTFLNPQSMDDAEKAVSRILEALKNNEKIVVYGDYDCDGVPGTALVRDFFSKIGYKNVDFYIPDRHKEGYGLNMAAIKHIHSEGATLILTIDLGTTNIEEIDYSNSLGLDVIVTDHHLPLESENGQILPKAYAVLNNKKHSCNYANKDLCGSGTVFKLVRMILDRLHETKTNDLSAWKKLESVEIVLPPVGYEKWLLDLVAIATIADMVPLTGENRTLAIYGLHVLSKTRRSGLHTIFKNAKVKLENIDEKEVAFTIAPRVNSASRMAHPRIALSMFSGVEKEGIDAAHELEQLNTERKDSTKTIVKKINKILDERQKEKRLPEVVVVGDPEWNPGILGILASKILDRYNVNVFVYGGRNEKNIFKGSCRSRGDIHLVKIMTETENKNSVGGEKYFKHFGGHELAGGFSISLKNVHELESLLNQQIDKARINNNVLEQKDSSKNGAVEIELHKIDSNLLDGLQLLSPFGVGNPKPVFKLKNISNYEFMRFGKSGEHLKIKLVGKDLVDRKVEREAIRFFVDEKLENQLKEKFINNELFFEVEKGFMSRIPRLTIID